jgi:hypothetical protein
MDDPAAIAAIAEAVVAAADAPASAAPHPLHAAIDAWFASHFHNSPISRDSELYNHVHAAVQDLKLRLTKES